MGVYVVERFLVGWSHDDVQHLVTRLEAAESLLAEHQVRHLGSVVIPVDETCLSIFEAPDPANVLAADERCSMPSGRVLAAVAHLGHATPSVVS